MITSNIPKKSLVHNVPGYFNYSNYRREVKSSNQLVPVRPSQITKAEEIAFAELVGFMPHDDKDEKENFKVRTDLPLSSDYVDDPRKLLFVRGALKRLQYA